MKAKASSQKKKAPTPERNGQEWQQLYDQVRKERNRLRKELTTAKEERDYFRKVVGTLMAKEFPEFDEEEVLAQMRRGDGQSFAELIAEVEAEFGR